MTYHQIHQIPSQPMSAGMSVPFQQGGGFVQAAVQVPPAPQQQIPVGQPLMVQIPQQHPTQMAPQMQHPQQYPYQPQQPFVHEVQPLNTIAPSPVATTTESLPAESGPSVDSGSTGGSEMAIKTLFVAGLPYDASDRELYLLFGVCKGYDKSMVVKKDNGKRPYGFVNFESLETAEAAAQKLEGFQFDPADPVKLKTELSRKNTPDWFTTSCASPASVTRRLKSMPTNPRTVYVTGAPSTVSKELFDALIATNFAGHVAGMRYTPPTDSKTSFAFVGFNTHEQARAAVERLEGYVWTHDGVASTLCASFANTEWNPKSRN